ncbi:chaperone NapD [Parahaliea aestuarii]|uniref:chaperone NapD n=1 Tax=Parahaliea aestuarii TaxID=1852021 RepID=UPI00164F913F|nr:chaperone NapD [Parahaliea aestuarii]
MSLHRRSFLTGRAVQRLTHIASLIVHCQPGHFAVAEAALQALPDVDVPASDPRGKLIVLLEVPDDATMMARIASIETIPGVISTTLVFHQAEALEEARLV